SPPKKKLRIVCISDTHNHTSLSLPHGDILIHAGDLTNRGTHKELSKTLTWLCAQPHELKLIVAGNHDGCTLDPSYTHTSESAVAAGIVYLNHEYRIFTLRDGRRIRVFASPLSPSIAGGLWGFGYPTPQTLASSPWAVIPEDTEVLITHTPPKYHLDSSPTFPTPGGTPEMHHGCEFLRQALWRVRPVLHVFGHIHQGRGVEKVTWDLSSRFIKYREIQVARVEDPSADNPRKQFLVDTVRRAEHRVARGEQTLLVNAAVATG
ncbi:Metallo-dependent phosphatase, partial [Wilcoxina mikolae CBS 423.85]